MTGRAVRAPPPWRSGTSGRNSTPPPPLVVLKDVSFDLDAGETLAIIGPSGAGKSTLLNIVGSLDKPTGGSVALGETEVTALEGTALADFRSRRVGFVFQDHHLLPQCSAIENVLLPTLAAARLRRGAAPALARETCWSASD